MQERRPPGRLERRLVALTRRPLGRPDAAFYEWVSGPAVCRIVAPVLEAELRTAPGGVVLDVGCGGGAIARELRRSGRRVVGVDPSIPQLRRLHRTGAFPCASAPAHALPVRPASFAAVVSSCAVKHWPSCIDGIAGCAQALAPGGLLVIVEVDGGLDDDELVRLASRSRVPPGLRRFYRGCARRTFVLASPTAAQLADDCAAVGLSDIRTWRIEQLPFTVVAAAR